MVNELKQLMRDNVAAPPPDHLDLDALVGAGRRRVRGRRALAGGAAATFVMGAVAAAAITWPSGSDGSGAAHEPPTPDAPTIRLADALPGVEGTDFEVVTSYTNENLDQENGEYFDGVTADGQILYQEGPYSAKAPRLALMDPVTGEKDWLPSTHTGQQQFWPVELGTDRLVLLGAAGAENMHPAAHVFDRGARQWSTIEWEGLPATEFPSGVVGPDGRLYVFVPASQGQIPEGGWPTGPDGEADDADAEGDTYHLWSVSLSDRSDVRNEQLVVGDLAFTDHAMVWTDSTNGAAGRVHVRDLDSGEEHSFDPHTGDKCNLLSFGATGDRIVMGEYCGTYAGPVRDDRVQILSTDGDQVVTVQDSGIDGATAGPGNDLVVISSYEGKRAGTYVYDLASDRFVRISDGVGSYAMGGPAPDGQFMWSTPVNHRAGATQWLGKLLEG